MKKNLFYLFALICSMSLFTACSDDDDDTWKQIPSTEISAEDATLQVNGQVSTEGSVKLEAKNGEQAVLTLTKVIPGYADVPVDVVLEKQANDSFKFSGSKDLTSAPDLTRAAASHPAIMTVDVSGNITLEGKITVTVQTSGLGTYVGVYKGDKLALKYSEVAMVGKVAVLNVIDGANMNLVLQGVLPGEPEATITGVQPSGENGAFSGEATTTGGTVVRYSGSISVATGILAIDVTATLGTDAQGGLVGSWPLSHQLYNAEYKYEDTPFFLNWPAIDKKALNGEQLANAGTALVSQLLAEVLNEVNFSADGNLTAKYYSGIVAGKNEETGEDKDFQTWMMEKIFAMDINPLDRTWITSPTNLIQWYVKDGKLYLIPNIAQILQQVAQDGGGSLDVNAILTLLQTVQSMDDATLMSLITGFGQQYGLDLSNLDAALVRQVLGWLNTGIPLNYKKTATGIQISVNKEMVTPFMPVLLAQLPALQVMWDELVAKDETGMMGLAMLLIGVPKFTDFITVWNENTADFGLGLFFANKK